MSTTLEALLKRSADSEMTAHQREEQRQSFAYGNTKFENSRITRETIQRASERLAKENGKS